MTAAHTRAAFDVAEWNATHAIGTRVHAIPGDLETGAVLATATRSKAWNVGGTAVVAVKGYPGGIALTHVTVCPGCARCGTP